MSSRRDRRPRRGGRRLAALATLLAPLAVVAALLIPAREDGRGPAPVAAAGVPASEGSGGAGGGQTSLGPAPATSVRLAGVDEFRVRLRKPPRAGLVFDLGTGEVLWRRNPRRRLPIASLTKMMTALVVVERTRPRERFRVARAAFRYTGSGIGRLPKRRLVDVEALLNGLMIVSGNDAAIALAHHVAGSERRFVALMNRRARALGLTCTRFVDSHGLAGGNRSCAADLAALARADMRTRRIARIVRRERARLRFPVKGGFLDLEGHNPLVRAGYPGAIGLKTGYTDAAGRCFVGVVRRKGRTLGVVLLNSPDPLAQSRKLLARAYGDPAPRGEPGDVVLNR